MLKWVYIGTGEGSEHTITPAKLERTSKDERNQVLREFYEERGMLHEAVFEE